MKLTVYKEDEQLILNYNLLITYAMNRPQLQIILHKVKQSLSKFYQDQLEKIILYPTFRRLVSKVNNIFGKRNRGKTEYVDVQGLS